MIKIKYKTTQKIQYKRKEIKTRKTRRACPALCTPGSFCVSSSMGGACHRPGQPGTLYRAWRRRCDLMRQDRTRMRSDSVLDCSVSSPHLPWWEMCVYICACAQGRTHATLYSSLFRSGNGEWRMIIVLLFPPPPPPKI